MLTLDSLKEYGANTEEGMGRCLNNEGFYFRLIKMAVDDANITNLKTAVEAGDLDAAFDAAHALKGITANLALTPIEKPVSDMTELLRNRAQTDYSGFLEEILAQTEKLRELCAE